MCIALLTERLIPAAVCFGFNPRGLVEQVVGYILYSPDCPLSAVRWLAFRRVSTDRQGRSGLGLEAQRGKVQAMAAERAAVIASEFVEVESERKNDRPQLAEA